MVILRRFALHENLKSVNFYAYKLYDIIWNFHAVKQNVDIKQKQPMKKKTNSN